MKYGLLLDYDWCTGCHSCEMACQMEHGLPVGQTGIVVTELGPWQYGQTNRDWQLTYLPAPTDLCDMCAQRTAKGKLPTCVHHCQAKCLHYGPVAELAASMEDGAKQALFTV